MSDLIVAVDVSRDGAMVVVVVGAREHVLKNRCFGRACSGLRHFRRVGSDRKIRYIKSFMKRYENSIKRLLEVVKVFTSIDQAIDFISELNPTVLIVDDKLYDKLEHPNKIRESSPKPKYMNQLLLIALQTISA